MSDGLWDARKYYQSYQEYSEDLRHYERLFDCKTFKDLPEYKIQSSGYVVHTLEAAIWCLLNTDNYKDCVLAAVNLGDDTDTVGAVTGGLAGIVYGFEGIPYEWRQKLKNKELIEQCIF